MTPNKPVINAIGINAVNIKARIMPAMIKKGTLSIYRLILKMIIKSFKQTRSVPKINKNISNSIVFSFSYTLFYGFFNDRFHYFMVIQ